MLASDSAKPAPAVGREPAPDIEQILAGPLDASDTPTSENPQPRSEVEQVDVDTPPALLQAVQYTGRGNRTLVTSTLEIADSGALRCRCGAAADQLDLISRDGKPALLECRRCLKPLATLTTEVEPRSP